MDAYISSSAIGAPGRATIRGSRREPVTSFAVLAAILAFVMMREQAFAVWRTGVFFDTDDGMHLMQVRALLGGQNWFDMIIPRLDPPIGTFMHWSRLVDVPVALIVKLFALGGAAPEMAERLARLAFPLSLIVALNLAMARLAALLLGPPARLPAIAATLLSGSGIIQFMPGRIDHHAPQIVILVVMLGSAIAALDVRRAKHAAITGLLTGLSLAINLENLPFLAVLAGGLVAYWVWVGDDARRMLGWYTGGLLVGLPLFFAATVGPSLYLAPVCDAFGAAHLGAGLIAAAGFCCAAFAGLPFGTRVSRGGIALAIAVMALAFVTLAYPACLHSPFAAVDPLVKELWLSRVEESLPLLTLARHDPSSALFALVPVVLGLAGCLFAACRGPRATRAGFALVGAIVACGLALAFWQVRVFSSVTAIALCGGLYAALAARAHWRLRGRETLASLSLALLFPFTATAVSLALPSQAAVAPGGAQTRATLAQCLAPDAFAPLAALHGRVIAPIDAGSYLLVHTDLDVFAAAFHRDNDGNRFAFDTMLAPAPEAGRMAAHRHVAFIMICAGLSDTDVIARRAPHGLAADLLAGRIPDWLAPMSLPSTPFRVFKVRPDRVF